MSLPTPPADTGISTRPYLIRALHEWCTENGFTPYIAVFVDAGVQVPAEYVKNNEIVLNIGLEATNALRMGNDFIEFKARFGGTAREIVVPVTHVIAIYARENGQGMAFPAPSAGGGSAVQADADTDAKRGMPRLSLADEAAGPARMPRSNPRPAKSPEPPPPSGPGRPSLKRVK